MVGQNHRNGVPFLNTLEGTPANKPLTVLEFRILVPHRGNSPLWESISRIALLHCLPWRPWLSRTCNWLPSLSQPDRSRWLTLEGCLVYLMTFGQFAFLETNAGWPRDSLPRLRTALVCFAWAPEPPVPHRVCVDENNDQSSRHRYIGMMRELGVLVGLM